MKLDTISSEKNKLVFEVKHLSKSFGDIPVITDFSHEFYSARKVCLTGPNGSGKSTLLKLLFGEYEATEGEIKVNPTLRIGYLSQDHLEIDPERTLIEDFLHDMIVEESEARTYLHKFLFKDFEVYRQIETFSQGEKAKYAFAKMLFTRPNYLLLDEPTNYMDMDSRGIIEKTLKEYAGGMILATHDRHLIEIIEPEESITMKAKH